MPTPTPTQITIRRGTFTVPPGKFRDGGTITLTLSAGSSVTITDPAGNVLCDARTDPPAAGGAPPDGQATVSVHLSGHPTPAGRYTVAMTGAVTGSMSVASDPPTA